MTEKETVTITFDGVEHEVPAGISVLEAAKRVGVPIPYFCWHKHLSVSGNCRMCLAMIEPGPPKPMATCATIVSDGMKVDTKNEKLDTIRRGVLEFLLANHPLDCPVCDKAYECKLQSYTYSYGSGKSRTERFHDEKRVHKRLDLGSKVFVEMNRCVNCTRCVRFLAERAGEMELGRTFRGHNLKIHTYKDAFESDFVLNAVDICPVGALGDKQLRAKARVWDLVPVPSISGSSSIGVNVFVDVNYRTKKVMRLRPRENDQVNYIWMPDAERLNIDHFTQNRVETCQVKGQTVSTEDAVQKLSEAIGKAGGNKTAFVLSPKLTTEELWLTKQLADALGAKVFFTPGTNTKPIVDVHSGPLKETMVSTDPYPNSTGGRMLGLTDDAEALFQAIQGGEVKVLVSFQETFDRAEFEDEKVKNALKALDFFALEATNETPLAEAADLVLPGAVWVEKAGTFVCDRRIIQRLRKAVPCPGDALGERQWLNLLAKAVLNDWKLPLKARDVFGKMVEDTALFKGLTWDMLGLLGVGIGDEGPLPKDEEAFEKEKKLIDTLSTKLSRDTENQPGHD